MNRLDVYREAAALAKAPVPKSEIRSAKLMDGVLWDAKDPKRYASAFKVRVMT